MWIPKAVLALFSFNLNEQSSVRQELAVSKAQLGQLERENVALRTTQDWMRMQVNDLQYANKALMEKAYNIKLPAPVIERVAKPPLQPLPDLRHLSFEDVGDEIAKRFDLDTP